VSTNQGESSRDQAIRSAASNRGENGGKAAHEDDTDTRNFIETHNVTKVSRKSEPGSGEESADLVRDEKSDPAKHGT
jgi:hypothetical protein